MNRTFHIGTVAIATVLLLTSFQNCSDAVPNGETSQASQASQVSQTLAAGGCAWHDSALGNGQSVNAFAVSSVPQGATCVSETRLCKDGVLSGSFTHPSCTILPAGSGSAKTVLVTSGTTWTVPNDFNPLSNVVIAIGSGARGNQGATGENSSGNGDCYQYHSAGAGGTGGTGGGSGAMTTSTNVPLTRGATVTIRVASGDTYLCGSTANCGSITGTSVLVGAKGGNGGNGGAANAGVGLTRVSGANGNSGVAGAAGTGGYLVSGDGLPNNSLVGGEGGRGGSGAGGFSLGGTVYGSGGDGGKGGTGGVPAVTAYDYYYCTAGAGSQGANGSNGRGGVLMITYVP